MRNPRRVLSKAQILDRVWNYDFGGQANVVELYISYLRKKIDAGREPMIHTMRGAGYVLKPATETSGRRRARSLPSSLTGRLVVTVMALVAVVSVLVAAVEHVVMRSYLTDRLDEQLPSRPTGPQARAAGAVPGRLRGVRRPRTRADATCPGSAARRQPRPACSDGRHGDRCSGGGTQRPRRRATLLARGVPPTATAHDVDLPGVGAYRVIADGHRRRRRSSPACRRTPSTTPSPA